MVNRPIATTTAMNLGSSWSRQGTSIRMDTMSLLVALLLHAPLYFVKVDAHKKQSDTHTDRLVSVDLLDTLKKEEPAPPPPPPAPKENSIRERLMRLVHREPPPPPPPPKAEPKPVEQKLVDTPAKIALQPKLDTLPKVAPALQSKTGFETTANPKLIEQKQLALNTAPIGIAPLSAKRLGVVQNRSALKADKGNFAVGSKELSGIGGDSGPALAGAGPAPTLAINTAGKGTVEKFSAAPIQKSDKGRIGGVSVPTVGGEQLGLRDSIIARDAGPSQIAGVNGVKGGAAGGIPGGVPGATKHDAGRFGGSEGGVAGGVVGGRTGGIIGGTGSGSIVTGGIGSPSRARAKKSMFTITGELSNRQIIRQVTPEYPAWAQAQGVEASVVLEFTVDAAGNVKPNIVVRRTTGYPKLDESAIRALKDWKFAPLPAGQENREEVGMITFNFALS